MSCDRPISSLTLDLAFSAPGTEIQQAAYGSYAANYASRYSPGYPCSDSRGLIRGLLIRGNLIKGCAAENGEAQFRRRYRRKVHNRGTTCLEFTIDMIVVSIWITLYPGAGLDNQLISFTELNGAGWAGPGTGRLQSLLLAVPAEGTLESLSLLEVKCKQSFGLITTKWTLTCLYGFAYLPIHHDRPVGKFYDCINGTCWNTPRAQAMEAPLMGEVPAEITLVVR